jgi:hypothetical protein
MIETTLDCIALWPYWTFWLWTLCARKSCYILRSAPASLSIISIWQKKLIPQKPQIKVGPNRQATNQLAQHSNSGIWLPSKLAVYTWYVDIYKKSHRKYSIDIWVYVDTNKHDIGQLASGAHLTSEVIPVMMREAIGARKCLEYFNGALIVNHDLHGRTEPL